jgi:hypothetical protein
MRKMYSIVPLFLAMMILFAASCGSSRSFGSRKYTAGNYVSHKHKAGKVTAQESPEQEPATVVKDEASMLRLSSATGSTTSIKNSGTEDTPLTGKRDLPTDEVIATDKTSLGMTSTESKTSSSTESTEKKAEKKSELKKKDKKIHAFKAESLKKYIADRTARKAVAADEDESSLDPVALVSFILGILGLALNILAISVIVATAEYVFTLLFIAGLVMGIIAVVFGTQGMRRYNKNKSGTINLVFSIIGTALGAGAIITSFIFAFYTLILALEGI